MDAAVKQLLVLKAEYKQLTGQDYKPGEAPVQKTTPTPAPAPVRGSSAPAATGLYEKVTAQGELVRKLKAEKAAKVSQVFFLYSRLFCSKDKVLTNLDLTFPLRELVA